MGRHRNCRCCDQCPLCSLEWAREAPALPLPWHRQAVSDPAAAARPGLQRACARVGSSVSSTLGNVMPGQLECARPKGVSSTPVPDGLGHWHRPQLRMEASSSKVVIRVTPRDRLGWQFPYTIPGTSWSACGRTGVLAGWRGACLAEGEAPPCPLAAELLPRAMIARCRSRGCWAHDS